MRAPLDDLFGKMAPDRRVSRHLWAAALVNLIAIVAVVAEYTLSFRTSRAARCGDDLVPLNDWLTHAMESALLVFAIVFLNVMLAYVALLFWKSDMVRACMRVALSLSIWLFVSGVVFFFGLTWAFPGSFIGCLS